MTFDFAAAIAERPSGANRAALVAFYGDPTLGATRTGKGQFEPTAAFRQKMIKIPIADLEGFPPYPDRSVKITGVTFHERVAPVFLATWRELVRRGLHKRLNTYDGAVTFRHMLWRYDNPVSVHAYGGAIDFDAQWNAYGIPENKMEIDPEVVRCFEECGWESGTRWNPTDGMHFQWTDPLPGVRQAEWRDAMARKVVQIVKPEIVPAQAVGAVVKVRNPHGQDEVPAWKDFVYNGTLVKIRGNTVYMEKQVTK